MDRRANRSRDNLLAAFRDLVLSRAYCDITVQDIVQTADVARSTFYQHFSDKRALLLASMHPMLDIMADAMAGKACEKDVQALVEHMWENRSLGRLILGSDAERLIANALADLIAERTGWDLARASVAAYGLLGAVRRWMTGEIPVGADAVVALFREPLG